MRERSVAQIVTKCRNSHTLLISFGDFFGIFQQLVLIFTKHLNTVHGKVSRANAVLKSLMITSRENQISGTQLMQVTQSLKLFSVYNPHEVLGQVNLAMDMVLDECTKIAWSLIHANLSLILKKSFKLAFLLSSKLIKRSFVHFRR